MLSYESSGTGVPLVFLHAFPLSRRMWDANRAVFSKNFRLITLDLPGFGESPVKGDTSSMADMARQVKETLDSLNISDKMVIAGLSMGGYVLLQLLGLMPGRFRALAFISTKSTPDTPEGREKRFKNIELVQKEGLSEFSKRMSAALLGKTTLEKNPKLTAEVQAMITKADPRGVCAALRGMAERPDTSAVLDQIQVPALVVAGEEDGVISAVEMESMARRIPKSRFELLPKAGHLLNMEQPDAFASVFLHFLKRSVL